jgi:hypothetical protein
VIHLQQWILCFSLPCCLNSLLQALNLLTVFTTSSYHSSPEVYTMPWCHPFRDPSIRSHCPPSRSLLRRHTVCQRYCFRRRKEHYKSNVSRIVCSARADPRMHYTVSSVVWRRSTRRSFARAGANSRRIGDRCSPQLCVWCCQNRCSFLAAWFSFFDRFVDQLVFPLAS